MHANAASAHRVSAPRLRARVARDATNHARRLCTAVRARPDDARDDADERERAGERVMDWREFRARLIARDTSNETLAALVDAAAACEGLYGAPAQRRERGEGGDTRREGRGRDELLVARGDFVDR